MYLVNDYFDFEMDLQDKSKKGHLLLWGSKTQLYWAALFSGILSLILSTGFSYVMTLKVALLLLANLLYSLGLKRIPFVDMLSAASFHFFVFLIPLDLSSESLLLISFFVALSLVGHNLHNIRDRDLDKRYGMNHTAVFLGERIWSFLLVLHVGVTLYLYTIAASLGIPVIALALYAVPLYSLIMKDGERSLLTLRGVSFCVFLLIFLGEYKIF